MSVTILANDVRLSTWSLSLFLTSSVQTMRKSHIGMKTQKSCTKSLIKSLKFLVHISQQLSIISLTELITKSQL